MCLAGAAPWPTLELQTGLQASNDALMCTLQGSLRADYTVSCMTWGRAKDNMRSPERLSCCAILDHVQLG